MYLYSSYFFHLKTSYAWKTTYEFFTFEIQLFFQMISDEEMARTKVIDYEKYETL